MATTGLRLELFVDDIGEAARFFEKALGFTVLGMVVPGAEPHDDYLPLTSGPVMIGLNRYASLLPDHPARGEPRGAGVEIVLEVEDVDAAYDRARRHADRVEAITDRPWGLRDFRVVTPGGYYVRVTSVAR
jgi:lactoylglutathione lyase